MKLYYAKFFDERGEYITDKIFRKYNETFKFKNRRYNIELKEGSYYEVSSIPLLLKKRYYFYNLSNSNPIKLDKKGEPIINPNIYNTIIESEEAKKLNNLHKGTLMNFLSEPKNIIILVIICAVGYYFLKGGTLT